MTKKIDVVAEALTWSKFNFCKMRKDIRPKVLFSNIGGQNRNFLKLRGPKVLF
jgi:hypothetical protein